MNLGNKYQDDRENLLGDRTERDVRNEIFEIERSKYEPLPLPEFISNQISIFESSRFLNVIFCLGCCTNRKKLIKEIRQDELETYYNLKKVAIQSYEDTNPLHEESLKILYIICLKSEVTVDLRNKEWMNVGFQVIHIILYKNREKIREQILEDQVIFHYYL